MNRKHVAAAAAVIILALVAGWFFLVRGQDSAGDMTIDTAPAALGDVRRTVSATGAVRALVTVQVGSQLSGEIAELHVDYNSPVEAGQVIARLNAQTFETRVRQAESSVAASASQVALQRASLSRVDANLRVAEEAFRRTETLHASGIASQAAFDSARATLDAARSERAVALAQITSAQAQLAQQQSALENARIDLERTVIRSPIDGVVVDRAVDVGQTVAASLSAPTLFTIAQDLSQVQIDARVDESDIGQIAPGQTANFTVDAFPGRTYEGRVDQVRLAPINTLNVVTYTVVITAGNPGQRLLPGMTANVDIVTGERAGVLTVPNAALRFRPAGVLDSRSRPLAETGPGSGRGGPGAGGRPGGPGGGGPGGGMMERIAEQLELTPEQRTALQSALQSAFASMRDEGGAPGAGGAGMRQRIDQAMAGVLTAEQMARYRAMQAAAAEVQPASVWVLEADGTLAERRVMIGVADTQTSEVVSGDLAAGEAVILRAREAR